MPLADIETAVLIFAAVHLTIIGLSHIVRPDAWTAFFTKLSDEGEIGVFVTAFLCIGVGSIIVAFHNVWSGLPIVLTLLGWAQLVKAGISFVWPSLGLKKLDRVTPTRAHQFRIPGIGQLGVALLLVYHLESAP